MDKRGFFRKAVWLFSIMAMTWILESFVPAPAQAIPAWARKYNADCSLCHYPNVPRLNSLGHEFRRAGFRMADEFNKSQDISKVGDFLSVRGRVQYDYRDREGQTIESEFRWNDTTLFYAGALTKSFTSFAELEWENNDDISLVASVGGVWGQSDHYSTFRIGQFHTLSRVGFGGFDRPTGISTPLIRTSDLTTGGVPFTIGEDQRGLELTHVFKKSRLIAQLLNGIDSTGDGNEGTDGDTDTAKDYTVAFEHILDDLASGFTLYGYWGAWYNGTPVTGKRHTFARYAVTGNKIIPNLLGGNFEFMGGYVRSQDRVPSSLGGNVQGNAFFVELEQYFERMGFTLLGRYDFVDPDDNTANDRTEKWTVGYVRTLQDYLRLVVEGDITQKDSSLTTTTDYRVLSELMVNF
jgi:hypothetical protein